MKTPINVVTSAIIAALLTAQSSYAQTVIVDESFDDYASQAAFEAVWRPDDGNGNSPLAGSTGILVPNLNAGLIPPNDDPPGIQGQGVDIFNDINEYVGPAVSELATLVPTETQSVRLSVDFFDDALGNKRASAGIRSKDVPSNIIEIGMWNADDTDPIDPNVVEVATGYAYRTILFGQLGGDLVAQPNWGFFPLDPALDRVDDPTTPDVDEGDLDDITSVADIGPGWHRYTAEVSLTDVTFTLDLFRDGLANTEATEGVGEPGVDSIVTWQIAPHETVPGEPDPFNSLRIGGPSGVTSANESVVDNVLLELVDITSPTGNADFNGDELVAGDDFLTWQRSFEITDGTALAADGDANGDGNVTAADLGVWQAQFGTNPGGAAAAAVPEPTSAALALASLAAFSLARRRSQPSCSA